MSRPRRNLLMLLITASLAIPRPGLADDATTEPMPPAAVGEIDGSDEPALDDARRMLQETAALDDAADLEAAEATLADAEQALADAVAAGAEPAEIERLTDARDGAQADVDQENAEAKAVRAALEAMSDEQVAYTNRALRDAKSNGTVTDLDAATLEDIVERDLGAREIQALTKALEEEAKFERIGARFEEKSERTGREQFLDQRDRAVERGARQRDKFERKVDRFVDRREMARDEVRAASREEAREEARGQAKAEAKRSARDEARRAGRENGRGRN